MLISSRITRYFSTCPPLNQFRQIMFSTFNKNQEKILNITQKRGLNFSLFMLKALRDNELPTKIRKQLITNLETTSQKITLQDYNFVCSRLPEEEQIKQIFSNPEKQFTTQKNFKINNVNISTHEIDESLQIDYSNYHKLLFEKSSHVFEAEGNEGNQKIVTKFSGKELNQSVRGIISEEQLFYDETIDEFLFKFNNKLLKQYQSNAIFRYAMRSKQYPLQLNMIDLPHAFIMQEICQRKSLLELQDILLAANLYNLLSKIKQTQQPQISCPKCSSTNQNLQTPDGYYSVLSQDADLHSQNKVNYIISQVTDITKRSEKQNILLLLSNEYAPFIRDTLKHYEAKGEPGRKYVTINSLKKQIFDRNAELEKTDTDVPLRKSVITQLLFQANPADIVEYYKSIGEEAAKKYSMVLKEYDMRLTLDDLDEEAGEKLERLFEEGEPCELLQLIFGSNHEFPETIYKQETIKKMFEVLDSQTENKEKEKGGKIKLNKQL